MHRGHGIDQVRDRRAVSGFQRGDGSAIGQEALSQLNAGSEQAAHVPPQIHDVHIHCQALSVHLLQLPCFLCQSPYPIS